LRDEGELGDQSSDCFRDALRTALLQAEPDDGAVVWVRPRGDEAGTFYRIPGTL
jgi:hypothetical protein